MAATRETWGSDVAVLPPTTSICGRASIGREGYGAAKVCHIPLPTLYCLGAVVDLTDMHGKSTIIRKCNCSLPHGWTVSIDYTKVAWLISFVCGEIIHLRLVSCCHGYVQQHPSPSLRSHFFEDWYEKWIRIARPHRLLIIEKTRAHNRDFGNVLELY